MALTNEQLEAIKTKIETDKIHPVKAIKELHSDENFKEIRTQLFEAYDRATLMQNTNFGRNFKNLTAEQKAERLTRLEKQISQLETRKARLEEQKAKLQE
jgi:ribosomal protein L14E/L6E/L27E